ncbi:MAG: ribonuclease P protein component 1 [Haloarculaceae archaeon]
MPLTPETLPRHELVGLDAEVIEASNPDLVGIRGEVVAETKQTLGIERGDRVSHVPKAGVTFAFTIDGERVRVDGERLVARPARRAEQTGNSQWR